MTSDIKLDGDGVIVEGKWTRLEMPDLMLDSPWSRQNQQGLRRALVHDAQDGLSINWNGDYPDGVKIRSRLQVEDCIRTRDIIIVPEESGEEVIPKPTPPVPPGSSAPGSGGWGMEGSLNNTFGVLHVLRDLYRRVIELRKEVEALKQKIAELER
jgi:hypothetical protein